MDHAQQAAIAGHVDAMVVARAEVERREAAVLEFCRQLAVAADQGTGRVAVPLGLEDLVAFDRAELADRAVDRTEEVGIAERPGAFAQRTGEEFVETAVGGDVGICRFVHVHAVAPDEPADEARCQRAGLGAGELAGEGGEGLFRQQVLGKNGEAIGHLKSLQGSGATIILARL